MNSALNPEMDAAALRQVEDKLKQQLISMDSGSVAIIGRTDAALDIVSIIDRLGMIHRLAGVFSADGSASIDAPVVVPRPFALLAKVQPAIVVIASDKYKESLLSLALPYLSPSTIVVLGGFKHFDFDDKDFTRLCNESVLPSYANGYPNTLIHIYQCLKNSSRLGLRGIVAEFGMFKGGTTMLLSRFIKSLGQDWPVYGFDTFDGFPEPRSVLDTYSHPDCVFLDVGLLRRCFDSTNVIIVEGDVVKTAATLSDKDIVLAFVDTDNYSSAAAILDVIASRVIPGGAIVFDHFTGRDRFLYTLGERIAAKRLLDDERYFNLHDTGVFLRLK